MHELRTHLANVLLALQMLLRTAPPGSPQAKVAQLGLSSASALIDHLLRRPDAGERPEKAAHPR